MCEAPIFSFIDIILGDWYLNNISNSKLTDNSKKLRKNMTKEERHLWYDFLKGLPVTVNRQKVIGKYIVDFCCSKYKVIIELDGSQHYHDDGIKSDEERDDYLIGLGYKVLRYSNREINQNFEAVCNDILKYIKVF